MLGNIKPMECIADKAFVENLKAIGKVASKLTRNMSNEMEDILDKYALTSAIQHLLADGVASKIPFYLLFTKDLIKITHRDSPTCFCWDEDKALWEEVKKSWVEDVYLKKYISRIYLTYYSIIQGLDDLHDTKIKDKNYICTFPELQDELLKLKDKAISNSKIRELFKLFISETVDFNFFELLDPIGFIAVKGKEVLDLSTGISKLRTCKDYFTREINVKYNPTANSPLLNQTIEQILLSDKEKINFLQEILGYSISGDCREGKMLMLIGETRAGKSIIISLIEATLGEYSSFLNKSIIVDGEKATDAPDPFLAELKGLRVGIINELKQVDTINTSKFKTLATNEKYTFRQLNSNLIEKVKSRHVLMLASNHKPIFPETDESIWERLWIIMCNAKFVDVPNGKNEFLIDRTLKDKLLKEHKEAFFKWLVDGSIRYFRNNQIKVPQSSIEALDEYRCGSQDENELFFSQCIEGTDNDRDRIQTSILYSHYKEWCKKQNNRKILSHTAFSETMNRKKFSKRKVSNWFYICIKYKSRDVEI